MAGGELLRSHSLASSGSWASRAFRHKGIRQSMVLPEMKSIQAKHFENMRKKAALPTGHLGGLQGGGGI